MAVHADADLPPHRPGEVLVRYKSDSRSLMARQEYKIGAKAVRTIGHGRVRQMALPPGLSVADALAMYKSDPEVEFVEPNYLLTTQTVLPDDPQFHRQWGLHNTGQIVNGYAGRWGADIDAVRAWALGGDGETTVVAVVDTGCHLNHLDLADNLWINPNEIAGNGIDDDGNGYVDDVRGWDFADGDNHPQDATGHGSHVAGIIAALDNNGIGGVGIGRKVRILPLRFMDASDQGSVADAIAAIEYALAHGVRIINCSWGGTGFSNALFNVMASADALFVCAAGNSGTNNDATGFYPAGFLLDNIIAVAASDQMDQLAGYSNYGSARVHLAAPGTRIYSLGVNYRDIWSEDFHDALRSGWTTGGHLDTWTVRSAPMSPGSSVLAVSSGDVYSNNADSWVMSPELSLHGVAAGRRLTFQLIGASEAGRDHLRVEVSTDAEVWTSRPVRVGAAIYVDGISGTIPYWTDAFVDLGQWDGANRLFVRFRFTSDMARTNAGFFIDNLKVSAVSEVEAYQFLSGTSMAAGFVSGAAALVLSQQRDLSPLALKSILMAGVDLDHAFSGVTSTGGRLNAFNALTLLVDLTLSARAAGGEAIRLNWSDQALLSSDIVVERRSEDEDQFKVVAHVHVPASEYTDAGLDPDTTYYYRLLARTQDGRSGYSNQIAAVTMITAGTAPESPTHGSGGGGGGCFISFLWTR